MDNIYWSEFMDKLMTMSLWDNITAQKMKFSIKDFFSKCKCDQIRRKLGIWSHLLRKSSMENFILCAVCEWYITAH